MKIVYLPGNSIQNKDEGEVITSALVFAGYDVYFHKWNHWLSQDQYIGWDNEAQVVQANLGEDVDELVLIGKSIGTLVALKLIQHYSTKVKKVILLGIPAADFKPEELQQYKAVLSKVNFPVQVIQNSQDPHGSTAQVKEVLKNVKYELIEKARNDHVYKYSEDILGLLSK